METLADLLGTVLEQVPENAILPDWIAIQSRGMKQWVTLRIAQRLGVCTNTRFLFPKEIIEMLLSGTPFSYNMETGINKEWYLWQILSLLHQEQGSKLKPVSHYIADDPDGRNRFQLSLRIAGLFDDYQVYRPDMISRWQQDELPDKKGDPAVLWQAALWKQLDPGRASHHLALKIDDFLKNFKQDKPQIKGLPSRISLFGIFSLPPVFLQLLERVSHLTEIHLFLLAPSNQYFFDLKSRKEVEKIKLEQPGKNRLELGILEDANPLLSSLGKAGSDFFNQLENIPYHEPFENLFEDPITQSMTMLACLQSDIYNLVNRRAGQGESSVKVDSHDTSITIHSCHSPMREAQVLKDLLLAEFEKDPLLSPGDVIVMMPDIESYAPYIESVFSVENRFDFSISDRKKRSDSETVSAFLKILSLKDDRLEKNRVMDLLLADSVAIKFGIQTEEIEIIQTLLDEANVLWGKDQAHKKNLGLPPFFQNTWEFGLRRLFLGMAMPDDGTGLTRDILPCPSLEGTELEILGKLADFCETIFTFLTRLKGPKTILAWTRILKQGVTGLIDQTQAPAEDINFLLQSLEQIRQDAESADFTHEVPFAVVHDCLLSKLDSKTSQGNFLDGRMTFCNLMPMRSIPYKIVALMGMDEASFPRQPFSPGFDLVKKFPAPGDKNLRDEDRYLFLETLLSAREKFIVTYTGQSIQDNSPVPCSGVISELCDAMDAGFTFEKGYNYHAIHPLHPFSEHYFSAQPVSFSANNCRIAQALRKKILSGPEDMESRFVGLDFSVPGSVRDVDGTNENITLEELVRFFKNPARAFIKEGLGVRLPIAEDPKPDREAYMITGLEQFALGSWLLEHLDGSTPQKEAYRILKAQGVLPPGPRGGIEHKRISNIASAVAHGAEAIINTQVLPPVTANIFAGGLTVTATLDNIHETGACRVSFGKLNGARLLSGWLRHLFLNAAAPKGYPLTTTLIGQDPFGRKPLAFYRYDPVPTAARDLLSELARFYLQGLAHPFSFFCETSWQFMQVLEKGGYDLSASALIRSRQKAVEFWYGGRFFTGEKNERHTALCFSDNDVFETIDSLQESGFVNNALAIYKPMQQALRRVV